jgi:hypothetical protein
LYCLYECVFFVSTRACFVIGLWAVKSARKWIELNYYLLHYNFAVLSLRIINSVCEIFFFVKAEN